MLNINLETFQLTQLPDKEDDHFEFKSSRAKISELKKKISYAVSGFANSGGGYFIAGVGECGKADGGFPLRIGKEDLRDWADQAVNLVDPTPRYEIKLIYDPMGHGVIDENHAVLLIKVHESYFGPHMVAQDFRYYIRAGAHTVPAKHFIVEAIWAKRHFSKPRLMHLFRINPNDIGTIQLGILALTDAPAINVKFKLSPTPRTMHSSSGSQVFPLNISVVNRENPFFFGIAQRLGPHITSNMTFDKDTYIEVEYCDLFGNVYEYREKFDIDRSIAPIAPIEYSGNPDFGKFQGF